jgi:hypothetical protein
VFTAEQVRPTRDDIGRRVQALLAKLDVTRKASGTVTEPAPAAVAWVLALGPLIIKGRVSHLRLADRVPLSGLLGLPS